MVEYLYFLCVDFMLAFADLCGVTYRDANMIVLFGLVPAVLLCDLLVLFCVMWSRSRRPDTV